MDKKKHFLILAGIGALGIMNCLFHPNISEAKVHYSVFDFEAHRGGRDARPENTLYSYEYALEHGVTSIEADMQLTKDGDIVMSHNPILNPTITRDSHGHFIAPNSDLDLRTMTVKDIQKYDVGKINPNSGDYYNLHGKTQISHPAKIPTLDEFFKLIKDSGNKDVILNLETKSYPDPTAEGYKNNPNVEKFVKTFNDKVKKYGMENRVVLQSFDWRTLEAMHKLNPNITLSALYCQEPSWGRDSENLRPFEKEKSPWLGGLDINDFKGDAVKAAHSIGADIVSPYYMEISKNDVEEAHSLGMKVVPWTVNSPSDMNMLLDMGVDGIISDKPWLLKEVLTKRGIKLNTPIYNKNSIYHLDKDHNDITHEKAIKGNDASV